MYKRKIMTDSVTITFYDYYRDKKGEIYEANTHTEWNYFSQRTTVIAEKYFRTISQSEL